MIFTTERPGVRFGPDVGQSSGINMIIPSRVRLPPSERATLRELISISISFPLLTIEGLLWPLQEIRTTARIRALLAVSFGHTILGVRQSMSFAKLLLVPSLVIGSAFGFCSPDTAPVQEVGVPKEVLQLDAKQIRLVEAALLEFKSRKPDIQGYSLTLYEFGDGHVASFADPTAPVGLMGSPPGMPGFEIWFDGESNITRSNFQR
ncbi:MAG: hypothetical protein OXQ29_05660 [Rhodospirillaceae bacterium]|nr:hypothetical protein [Rhodospirillaceae bacterium]